MWGEHPCRVVPNGPLEAAVRNGSFGRIDAGASRRNFEERSHSRVCCERSAEVPVRPVAQCPACGAGDLDAVPAGDGTNFLCRTCDACWRVDLGRVREVDPRSCPECSHVEICWARVEALRAAARPVRASERPAVVHWARPPATRTATDAAIVDDVDADR